MRLRDITCVSDLYYVIGRWFTVIMLLLAFATVPFALEQWDSIFAFLTCAGIGFVGCAAHYKDKTEKPVHYISACVSAVCSMVWTACLQPWYLLVMLIALVGLIDKKRRLLWCELPCFLQFYLTLFAS